MGWRKHKSAGIRRSRTPKKKAPGLEAGFTNDIKEALDGDKKVIEELQGHVDAVVVAIKAAEEANDNWEFDEQAKRAQNHLGEARRLATYKGDTYVSRKLDHLDNYIGSMRKRRD